MEMSTARTPFRLQASWGSRATFSERAVMCANRYGTRTARLLRCISSAALLQLLDHAFEIGIAGTKAPCEPVATAFGDFLAIRDHLKLTGLTRCSHGLNVEALFDQGHETRDLGFVVLSGWTGNDFDFHSVLRSAPCSNRNEPAAQRRGLRQESYHSLQCGDQPMDSCPLIRMPHLSTPHSNLKRGLAKVIVLPAGP